MKIKQAYLSGRAVFLVSLIVIGITVVTVYLTGENYSRSVSNNFYLSLSIIGACLFLFMSYGLYYGIGLIDNFPEAKSLKDMGLSNSDLDFGSLPDFDLDGGIAGIAFSIFAWLAFSVLLLLLLVLLDIFFWFSIFIVIAALYWLFFRALKLVFNKAAYTQGHWDRSLLYALGYTTLYTGWLFAIVLIADNWG